MRKLQMILCMLIPFVVSAQTEYFTVTSQVLQSKREVKLQLPRTYNSSEDQSYPLVVVFDGDYLFEPIAGTMDYLSYWDEVPEAIIVGINQSGMRKDDFQIGSDKFLPQGRGADFFDFIEVELVPMLEEQYRIAGFKMAVGHNRSANFINFFLLRETLLFNAYISLSPLLSIKMPQRIENSLSTKGSKLFYYLSYAEQDFSGVLEKAKPLSEKLKKIENDNVEVTSEQIDQATHFTMVSRSIPKAVEEMFSIYRPITPQRYQDKLLENDDIIGFLEQKYIRIEELYALEVPIRVNDILFAAKAIKEKEKWDALKDLSKIAEKNHPEKILGNYYRALHYEKIGKPKKAIKYYNAAYSYEPVEDITKDKVLAKAEELKELFGY